MQQNRRLAAILFTDIVGSTAVMQKDEQAALSLNKRYVAVLKQCVATSGGEILNDYGDGSLCTFHSATEALRCAMSIQQQLQQEPKVPLRIGLHSGEIFFDDGKVLGDAVNVASRVQSLGIANSILFSAEVCNKIKNQQEFKSISLGKFHFKNVDEPMEVFALANEGLVIPDKKKIEGKLKEKSNKNKLFILTSIIIAASILFFIAKKNASSFSETEKSIAILPLEVTGNNEDNLASGLAEDILIHLSKIKEFDKVISNKSSSQYKDSKKNLKEIGEELGAVFLVTGRIEESNNKIRVSAQLVDSRDGKTIWAEDYIKQNAEIFDLQTELATQIVAALKTNITSEEKTGLAKRYTGNVEAYRFYRKGRAFWDQRTKESYDSAELYYKKAIDLDPDYALAYSGLADLYTFNQKNLPQLEAIPIAREYAKKALLLDSTLTEALTTIAFIQFQFDYDLHGAQLAFEKIIHNNPNYAVAHLYYGNILVYTGKIQEGISENKKALSLDPLSTSFNSVLGRNYYYAREYDSAIMQLQKSLTLNPAYKGFNVFLGRAYLQKKLYNKAIDAFSKLQPLSNDQGTGGFLLLSYTYALKGDITTAKSLLEKVPEEYRTAWPYYLSCIYVGMKDASKALTQLENAYQAHAIGLVFLKMEPAFDPIRNEPRFKALLKKMNLD